MKKKDYHHGDLEVAIVTAAVQYIEENNADTLSLRQIAKTCGVSATAIYRHFANKEALFARIATEGFMRLQKNSEEEQAKRLEIGTLYVEFSLDNSGYFAIMFGDYIKDHRDYPALYQASHDSYEELVQAIARSNPDLTSEQLDIIVKQRWSLMHGLAILMSKHFIDYEPNERRQIIESILSSP